MKQDVTIKGAAHSSIIHDSAIKHVTGRAEYTDDLNEPAGTLHAYLGLSTVAHGRITSLDLDAVRKAPGVHLVLTADDVPGENDISATGLHDEPLLARDLVQFHGQPIFAVIAETRDQARRACQLAQVDYAELPHATDVLAARDAGMGYVTKPLKLARGDMAALLALQTAQRGQCVGEAAFLVGHLGVEHQGRCLGTRIVGPRMLQPVALLFRLAHALGGTRCNQG